MYQKWYMTTNEEIMKELLDHGKMLEDHGNELKGLKEQVALNCSKFDKIPDETKILPEMYNMLQAAGQNNEKRASETTTLDARVTKLESR